MNVFKIYKKYYEDWKIEINVSKLQPLLDGKLMKTWGANGKQRYFIFKQYIIRNSLYKSTFDIRFSDNNMLKCWKCLTYQNSHVLLLVPLKRSPKNRKTNALRAFQQKNPICIGST